MRAAYSVVALVILAAGGYGRAAANENAKVREILSRRFPGEFVCVMHENFRDAIDFFGDVAGVKFEIAWKAIEATGVSGDAETNQLRRLPGRSIKEVRPDLLLDATGGKPVLDYYIENGIVHITTRQIAGRVVRTVVYAQRHESELGLIPTAMVFFGQAKVGMYKGNLIVTAPRFVHEHIGGWVD